MNKYLLLTALLMLTACSKRPLECHSAEFADLVKQIVWSSVKEATPNEDASLSEADFKNNLELEYARPTDYDEKIEKYTCAATIKYKSYGIIEFEKTLQANGNAYSNLAKLRKNAVKSPLIYSALSILSDHPQVLSDLINNSDSSGYKFETVMSSQKVGEDNLGEVAIGDKRALSLYVAAVIGSAGFTPTAENEETAPSSTEEIKKDISSYTLTSQEKIIVAKSLSNFNVTYKQSGVSGVSIERDQCYQAAKSIKEKTLSLQCIAYDYISASLVTAMETESKFPATAGYDYADFRVRALGIVEDTLADELSSSAMKEGFITSIKSEADGLLKKF